MTLASQTTLKEPVSLEGIAIHSGAQVHLKVLPAPADTGFVFRRVDLEGSPEISASPEHAVPSPRGTKIQASGAEVQTVEHLLAGLRGAGVDNAWIELDAGEPPGMDGSAQPFVEAFLKAGLETLDAPRTAYQVLFPVAFHKGDTCVTAMPDKDFRITLTTQYPDTLIGTQSLSFVFSPENFQRELMDCRTFCLKSEVDALKAAGLVQGGSLENAVVVDGPTVLNPEGTRRPDEFVRHKILDLIGDLALAGAPIRGHFVAHRSGHIQNVSLLRKLFEQGALGSVGLRPGPTLDIEAIRRILPHRYPFLLVDRIEELSVNQRAVGYKAVTIDEPFFQGHFPGRPVMPGVLIMEALAQVAGVVMLSRPDFQGKMPYFTGLDQVRFRRPIVPGDLIRLEVEIDKIKLSMGRAQGTAYVGDQVAANGVLKFTLVD